MSFNMVSCQLKKGPWKDPLFGEWVYIFLSLTAKTVLAWIIWSGTLAP
ncbi:MAG: hypothetical protein R6X16_12735 [Anaerolineae bacterium]